jgi:DNA-binding GntR family transcriptional regulator
MIRFRTKEDIAYEYLREAILSCSLPPGERIIIDRLAEDMGISQIPVRAAVQRLAAEGLVVNPPHSSASVASLLPAKVEEVFTLLAALERTTFRKAAAHSSPETLKALQSLLEEMDKALEMADPDRWQKAEIRFHRCIAENAGMPMLLDFTNRVLDEWERIYHFYSDASSGLDPDRVRQYHEILENLKSGDADRLAELAAACTHSIRQTYQPFLRREQ